MNKPHKKIIGNLKKFEKVCASKTSFAETAIESPRSVDTIDKRTIPVNSKYQFNTADLKYNTDISTGIKLLIIPKSTAPLILENTSNSVLIGARSSLSNERALLSKVIVTASIEVVPKSIDIATIPANISSILKAVPDLKKNISIHAKGKIIPHLIFGGFK